MDDTAYKQQLIEELVHIQEAIFNQITLPMDVAILKQETVPVLKERIRLLLDMAATLDSEV